MALLAGPERLVLEEQHAPELFQEDPFTELNCTPAQKSMVLYCCCLTMTRGDMLPPAAYVGSWKGTTDRTLEVEASGRVTHRTAFRSDGMNGLAVFGWKEPPEATHLQKKVTVCCCIHVLNVDWHVECVDADSIRIDGELFTRVEQTGPKEPAQIERA